MNCSSCNCELTKDIKHYEVRSEKNAYHTCVTCISKAAMRLKGMKRRTFEQQALLDQLERLQKRKVIKE